MSRWSREMRRGAGTLMAGLLMVLSVAACTPDDQETRTLDPQGSATRAQLSPELVAALDSGTTAFREHRFEDALGHYERAAELDPEHPGGWFGVSMAQEALGNTDEAEAALERVRDLAPGATILHPDSDSVAEEGAGEAGGRP